ncbi:MAG: hypothetical protein HZB62_10605 [Nitrospirae bacterium]|nr:hypothetical protein [Nitrospirota bacterium]
MSISATVIEQIRRDLDSAPFGHQTTRGQEWAAMVGVAYPTLCKLLKPLSEKKRASKVFRPEYHEWTPIIFAIKKSPPSGGGEISTDQAVKLAVEWHKIPATALEVEPGTFDRIAREKGLNRKQRRVSRFQADKPNRLHHFDASSSKFLYIAKETNDGDYILKLHRPGSIGSYKNKPIPCNRLRPWYYGIVDDHSGRFEGSLFAAEGETGLHNLKAICTAWESMGIPEELLADQGMLKKNLISKEMIGRLDVKLPESMPYAKEAHGKIERPWRTIWQRFERPFFAGDWTKFSILLSELQHQFAVFLSDDYNQLEHRFERDITRMQAWSRINLHGGIVQIPADAIAAAARRKERTIDSDGILRYDGKLYDVKHLHSAKVIVFEGVFNDRLIVQDMATGKKYEVRDFKPLNVGEYKGHADTPHQALIKEYAPQLTGTAPMLYAEKKEQTEKVVSMPIRTKEERTIEDPFNINTYPHIDEAMKDFMSHMIGIFLTQEERGDVAAAIEAHGLDRQWVENFALEVRANMSKRVAM